MQPLSARLDTAAPAGCRTISECYHFYMEYAGFVLVGGRSSRMGRDKATLPYEGLTLAGHIAARVKAAAGSATLVGPPEKYGGLGYPVIPDLIPQCGPLSGVHAALEASRAEWNLVVACDMPAVTVEFLKGLLTAAGQSGADCLLPVSPSGRAEPLCAVYRRTALPGLAAALRNRVRKVREALQGLRVARWPVPVPDLSRFENLNTPEDWTAYCASHGRATAFRQHHE